MTKEQMKKVADGIFGHYPKQEKVFITSDGQAFFNESDAKNHAVKNRSGKELDVEKFIRKDESQKPGKNAKDSIAEIKEAETIEAVAALLNAEKAAENRKTVIEAGEKRIEELKNTQS